MGLGLVGLSKSDLILMFYWHCVYLELWVRGIGSWMCWEVTCHLQHVCALDFAVISPVPALAQMELFMLRTLQLQILVSSGQWSSYLSPLYSTNGNSNVRGSNSEMNRLNMVSNLKNSSVGDRTQMTHSWYKMKEDVSASKQKSRYPNDHS